MLILKIICIITIIIAAALLMYNYIQLTNEIITLQKKEDKRKNEKLNEKLIASLLGIKGGKL